MLITDNTFYVLIDAFSDMYIISRKTLMCTVYSVMYNFSQSLITFNDVMVNGESPWGGVEMNMDEGSYFSFR